LKTQTIQGKVQEVKNKEEGVENAKSKPPFSTASL
jgi:hypothetical protein